MDNSICWQKLEAKEREISRLREENENLKKMYPCCTVHGQPACLGCSSALHNAEEVNRVLMERNEVILNIPEIIQADHHKDVTGPGGIFYAIKENLSEVNKKAKKIMEGKE